MPLDLSDVISRVRDEVSTKSGRRVEIFTDQGENRLVCVSPYEDKDRAHEIHVAERNPAQAVILGDMLRLLDHVESRVIFDLPKGAESHQAHLVYGLYTTTVGQRIMRRLIADGVAADGWAPFVSTFHNYRNAFGSHAKVPLEFKGLWDLVAAHAYADSFTAMKIANIPSARQAVKTIKGNKALHRAVEIGDAMSIILLDFEDTRDWTERAFIALMRLVGLEGILEIREAATGKVLQAPRLETKLK